ncbi:hypothetical protein BSLG_009010 [Batrachochytrium salamandrivorans]|nr:hypothetical protein BSLG_009010 [Batrachochytrium salamandrivorans]
MDQSIEAAVHLANREFIKGFIAGQVILGALIFFLLKVFLFRNADETRLEHSRRTLQSIAVPKPKTVSAQQRRTIDSLILGKIGYDTTQHTFESCDWLSVLVAQILLTLRTDAEFSTKGVQLLDSVLNGAWKPAFLGAISITDFSLGEEYPTLKNGRVRFAESDSGIKVQIDFSFDDQITLGIDTQMLINWPKLSMAALPVSIVLSVVKFSGTFVIEFLSEPVAMNHQKPMHTSQGSEGGSTELGHQTFVSVSVLDDFILEFDLRSLLGHRTKVKDLPKLTSLICTALRSMFISELVWPACKTFKMPSGGDWFGYTADTASQTPLTPSERDIRDTDTLLN